MRHFENIRAFIKGATAGKIEQQDASVPEDTNERFIYPIEVTLAASGGGTKFKYTCASAAKFLTETRTFRRSNGAEEETRGARKGVNQVITVFDRPANQIKFEYTCDSTAKFLTETITTTDHGKIEQKDAKVLRTVKATSLAAKEVVGRALAAKAPTFIEFTVESHDLA
jgi:hypothetical protein